MNEPRMRLGGDAGAAHQARLQVKERLASRVENLLAPPPARQPRYEDPGLRASAVDQCLRDGVDICSLVLMNAQKRDALVASVAASFAPPPAEVLLSAVTGWLAGDDHTQKAFEAAIRPVLTTVLDAETRSQAKRLSVILKPSEADRRKAVDLAIRTSRDLRERLLSAEDDRDQEDGDGLQAAGRWGLKTLLTRSNYSRIVDSFTAHANNAFAHLSLKRGNFEDGFDGARKWVSDPKGRHAELNGEIDEDGSGWTLSDRGPGLGAKTVLFPQEDPTDVSEWSGSRSHLLWRHTDRRGQVTWHTA